MIQPNKKKIHHESAETKFIMVDREDLIATTFPEISGLADLRITLDV